MNEIKDVKTFKLIMESKQQSEQNLIHGPWRYFLDEMKKNNFQIDDSDNESDLYLFFGHNRNTSAFSNSKKSKRILVMWEPPATEPRHYRTQVFQNYQKILVPFPLGLKYSETYNFHWPQTFSSKVEPFSDWNKRQKVNMIQANKFSFSKTEQYTLRRSVIKHLGAEFHIDLYGRDWKIGYLDLSRKLLGTIRKSRTMAFPKFIVREYPYYKGESASKMNNLANYKISIVIENDLGYFSEKFFDAVACQTIPIYVGPSLSLLGLGDLNFLQAAPNLNSIRDSLNYLMSQEDIELHKMSEMIVHQVSRFQKVFEHKTVFRKLALEVLNS